jgi:hypothetical protein
MEEVSFVRVAAMAGDWVMKPSTALSDVREHFMRIL